ncbi:unnamed protein product [Mytilus edulis]|uniref:C-type lectin domain-containing protein n=1 Tax=Mytilus edulis TaxID=6550 RepID=A0A8S3SRX2_MYTED|nr:unnamed protein product [Mytilus edulis]
MYAFTWTLCVDSRINDGGYGEFGTELVVDGQICGTLHADTESQADDACSTGFIIKYVRKTGKVYLRNNDDHQACINCDCHTGWIHFQNSCYLFGNDKLNWYEASSSCLSHHADLVKVETVDEETFLKTTARALGTRIFWLGARDDITEGIWVWSADDSDLDYYDWYLNEPNNSGGNEDCLELSDLHSCKWNDAPYVQGPGAILTILIGINISIQLSKSALRKLYSDNVDNRRNVQNIVQNSPDSSDNQTIIVTNNSSVNNSTDGNIPTNDDSSRVLEESVNSANINSASNSAPRINLDINT